VHGTVIDQAALTDVYKSTGRLNTEPRLAVITVIQFVDELELHRDLQHSHFDFSALHGDW